MIFYTVVLLGLFLYVRWLARQSTYPAPDVPIPTSPPAGITEISLKASSGEVHGWLAEPENLGTKTPLMVFFHGNAENLATLHASGLFDDVTARGLGLLAIDFPGYGRSQGRAGEAALIEAGMAAVRHAVTTWPERPLLLSGWSLGAAVAVQVSASGEFQHKALLLVSPWSRLKDVAEKHFPNWLVGLAVTEAYDSVDAAARVTVPTLVVHGSHDLIIPLQQGYQVSAALATGQLVPIPLAGHNDILTNELFWKGFEALRDKYLFGIDAGE